MNTKVTHICEPPQHLRPWDEGGRVRLRLRPWRGAGPKPGARRAIGPALTGELRSSNTYAARGEWGRVRLRLWPWCDARPKHGARRAMAEHICVNENLYA